MIVVTKEKFSSMKKNKEDIYNYISVSDITNKHFLLVLSNNNVFTIQHCGSNTINQLFTAYCLNIADSYYGYTHSKSKKEALKRIIDDTKEIYAFETFHEFYIKMGELKNKIK